MCFWYFYEIYSKRKHWYLIWNFNIFMHVIHSFFQLFFLFVYILIGYICIQFELYLYVICIYNYCSLSLTCPTGYQFSYLYILLYVIITPLTGISYNLITIYPVISVGQYISNTFNQWWIFTYNSSQTCNGFDVYRIIAP